MERLADKINKNIEGQANSEWGTIIIKAIEKDYLGDCDDIFVMKDSLFIYHDFDENFVKIPSIKTLFKNLVKVYEDTGRTYYRGDKLRKYVVNEVYNSLNENNTVSDLIALIYELGE